jgi:hypothetical protein
MFWNSLTGSAFINNSVGGSKRFLANYDFAEFLSL